MLAKKWVTAIGGLATAAGIAASAQAQELKIGIMAVLSGPQAVLDLLTSITNDGLRVFTMPERIPFTLIGVGGVTALYTLALPKARPARH